MNAVHAQCTRHLHVEVWLGLGYRLGCGLGYWLRCGLGYGLGYVHCSNTVGGSVAIYHTK